MKCHPKIGFKKFSHAGRHHQCRTKIFQKKGRSKSAEPQKTTHTYLPLGRTVTEVISYFYKEEDTTSFRPYFPGFSCKISKTFRKVHAAGRTGSSSGHRPRADPERPARPAALGKPSPHPCRTRKPRRAQSGLAARTCTMMAIRSESLGMLSLHFLQEARPLLAYSTR